AAPPAAQAIVAGATTREERTRALTLLGSAFGLGTILGPALAPFLLLPVVGLAGPAYIFALFGFGVLIAALRLLPADKGDGNGERTHGAATAYPSIGGQSTGASDTAAIAERTSIDVKLRDPRIWPWMLIGLVMGHAQAMTGQAIGFLIIDRLALPPELAQQSIGIVLMTGAGATLLAQWGIIPLLGLSPRALVISGMAIAALGCALTGISTSLYGISVAFALSSLGFGFVRPGYTAGTSLAVGADEQGAVAGRVTAVNGAAFVLGPSIGVGLYEFYKPFPYWIAAAALALTLVYALRAITPSDPGGGASPAR
ncbi:MAG: MFS transporter, partial [Sphingomonadaceae bacterium]